jgi:hypothetical protein
MSYKARHDAAAGQVAAQRTRQVVNQNQTTSQAEVNQARAEESQRRSEGKPQARKP